MTQQLCLQPACPVRPVLPYIDGETEAHDDDSVEICQPCSPFDHSKDADQRAGDEEKIGDGGAQKPMGRPEPGTPTKDEYDRHMLTHLPYRRWCWFCVAARRRNDPHFRLPPFSRTMPLMVADYCFVRDSRDQDLLVLMVVRMYPSRATFAIPCDVKGSDEYATHRLANCVRCCGVVRMSYMCDQECSLNTAIVAALRKLKVDGEWAGAVPEHSAVGESQSNGRAEVAVQTVEDQLRTLKHALEHHIGARIPSTHPVMMWMAEYTGTILTKYSIDTDGTTPYQHLHGRRVAERLVQFGEKILFHIPAKKRANLDIRWTPGRPSSFHLRVEIWRIYQWI